MKIQSLESRIRAAYGELSPNEKRLADTILNFPGELASYSATELAQAAAVSKAAATRFFQRLGYASYDEARREARAAQRWGSPFYLQTKAAEARGMQESLASHVECEISNITGTFSALSPDDLDAAAGALAGARRVYCVGFRTSQMIASYARWLLMQVRDGVSLLPAPGETLSEHLAGIGPQDVMLAIGLRRRTPGFANLLAAARASGARVILVADQTADRSAKQADWLLRCECRSSFLFDSDLAAKSLVHFLCSAVVSRLGKAGRDHMKSVEDLLNRLGEFH
jgi:DNA-binding MurR/RpiR family transcriptional regulator